MPNWKSHFARPQATHRPEPAQTSSGSVAAVAGQPSETVTTGKDETATATHTTAHRLQRASAPEPQKRTRAAVNAALPQNQTDTSWHGKYIELLSLNGGQKTAALKGCIKANGGPVTLWTLAHHRNTIPEFAADEKMALGFAMETAEAEARRRAIDGVESTVTTTMKDGSTRVYSERKYDGTMLLRLLERLETGSWRQKQQIEHSGAVGFKTAAERKAALERAEAIRAGKPVPVSAINGRS